LAHETLFWAVVLLFKGLVIEEIIEDDTSEPSNSQRSASAPYTISQPHEVAGNSGRSGSTKSLRNDRATIR
jgi:hypothetical protein